MKLVWFCADQVGAEMAGPGIRAVELALRLARRHQVTLVAPGATDLLQAEEQGLALAEPEALAGALCGADAFVAQGFGFPLRLALRFPGRLVLDLYDPVQLEQLAQFGPAPTPDQRLSLAHVRGRLLALLARADQLLCASPRQRAWWLGWLGAAGRLSPLALAEDPAAERLVAVVPFGLPEGEPPARTGALRVRLAVPPGAPLALFWGGLWDWMDPALAVRALAHLRDLGTLLHLVLLAGARPGGDTMRAAADEARAAVSALGLTARVHFLDRWVPYAERGAVLAEADLAVTAHRPSVEAELAFRTRILDCLWAQLPPACTRGDMLAEEAEREGWGTAAGPGDVEGLAAAMSALALPGARDRAVAAMDAARARYRWERSAETLTGLLEAPAPPRPALLVPGEVAGAQPRGLAAALAGRVWGRLAPGRARG